MQGELWLLTWVDFDRAVYRLNRLIDWENVKAIYGQPRGGLPLAVALSHRSGKPMSGSLEPGCLWVDDIIDSGATFDTTGGITQAAVWVRRQGNQCPVLYVETAPQGTWVVFPWEDAARARKDRESYAATRQ